MYNFQLHMCAGKCKLKLKYTEVCFVLRMTLNILHCDQRSVCSFGKEILYCLVAYTFLETFVFKTVVEIVISVPV
jgi:hypothetical protein